MINGVREFMERKGNSKLEDFRGIALERIHSKMELFGRYTTMVSIADEALCTGCELCITICPEKAPSLRPKG